MRIAFNQSGVSSLVMKSSKWSTILKKLHDEYYAEELEIPFKKWIYDKYEIQVFYQQLTMPNGISRIDVPDNAVTYLKLRFS